MSKVRPAQEISTEKLFEVMQLEYLICILRVKIYPLPKHKAYWERIAGFKKEKIFYTQKLNNLISIFDDERIYKDFEKKAYNEWGLPNFYYPKEDVKEQQVFWDIRNYFKLGSLVKFIDSENDFLIKEGVVKSLKVENEIVLIESNKKNYEVKFEFVKRIL